MAQKSKERVSGRVSGHLLANLHELRTLNAPTKQEVLKGQELFLIHLGTFCSEHIRVQLVVIQFND